MTAGLLAKGRAALRALATRTVTIDRERTPSVLEDVPLHKIPNQILVEDSISSKPKIPW
jgi:hypothetical protein